MVAVVVRDRWQDAPRQAFYRHGGRSSTVATSTEDEVKLKSWDIKALDAEPHKPVIVSSSDDARIIVIDLPPGGRMQDHEVKERAFVMLVMGEIEMTAADGTCVAGGAGLLIELAPRERHEVVALTQARFVLLLTPWPAKDHPGTMSLAQKAQVRARAAEHVRDAG